MNLYLDDDIAADALTALLRRDGHDVQLPTDAGLAGDYDPNHLAHAIANGRVLMSQNHWDFKRLHLLVRAANGHHPGILIIRKDNDRRRDMKPQGIARAVRNLVAANVVTADQFIILNDYR
jgi:predicted nuclease of predicted toxin-antitoxin system